jgi:divalent metal cation (Fe/Co/Zn/Cd) transporter
MIAASLIWYEPSWRIADPICTFIFSIIVIYTTVQLVRESIGVLMEGTPEGIQATEVEARLMDIPHVVAVHDLHIWSLSLGKPSLSVHLQVDLDTNRRPALVAASKMLARTFGIHHSTIQVEEGDDNIHCNANSAIATGHDTPATPGMPGLISGPTTPLAPLPAAVLVNSTAAAVGAKKPVYGSFDNK